MKRKVRRRHKIAKRFFGDEVAEDEAGGFGNGAAFHRKLKFFVFSLVKITVVYYNKEK